MRLIDRIWSYLCHGRPTVLVYQTRVVNGVTYYFKKVTANEIALDVLYGNEHNDFGVVFKSVVNDQEHSPCVTMKYPPKDKYQFIHVQDSLGTLGTSLLGDYKEWSDAEISNWIERLLDAYGKLAEWRIWVSQKFKELESSLLEPDWNIVYSMIREMEEKEKKILKSSNTSPSQQAAQGGNYLKRE